MPLKKSTKPLLQLCGCHLRQPLRDIEAMQHAGTLLLMLLACQAAAVSRNQAPDDLLDVWMVPHAHCDGKSWRRRLLPRWLLPSSTPPSLVLLCVDFRLVKSPLLVLPHLCQSDAGQR